MPGSIGRGERAAQGCHQPHLSQLTCTGGLSQSENSPLREGLANPLQIQSGRRISTTFHQQNDHASPHLCRLIRNSSHHAGMLPPSYSNETIEIGPGIQNIAIHDDAAAARGRKEEGKMF